MQASTPKLNADDETKLSTNVKVVNVVMNESLKTQGAGRSRSSRLSRDLDIDPEALTNAKSSYTSLLLEDIHDFGTMTGCLKHKNLIQPRVGAVRRKN